jgi:xanthine/uracil/vitamin C permease (AzgA family)
MSSAYGCQGGVLRSAPTWLGIAATLLIVLLMAAEVNGAVAYGVLFATVIAWIPGATH